MNQANLQTIRAKVFNDYANENWEGMRQGNPKDFSNVPQVIDDVILLTIKAIHSEKSKGGINMGEIVVKNAVERKEGYIYYIDGEGNLCEAKRAMGGKKKSNSKKAKVVAKKTVAKKPAVKKAAVKKKK